MQLDDERESDYVEDRRSDTGDQYGSGGGDPYGGGNPYGGGGQYGGPSGGSPFGGLIGGLIGGVLGGIFSRPRPEDPYRGDPNRGAPYGSDPYGGRPDGGGGGMGPLKKIGIVIVIIFIALIVSLYFNSARQPAPAPTPTQRAQTAQPPIQRQPARPIDPARDPQAAMVTEMKKVLAKTEDTWDAIFKQMGRQYQKPRLVLFTNTTQSGCGQGKAATGPFYCPPDQRVYLDLRFFNEMERRFKVSGDFARAYVIAHEVGHHVQHLNGTMQKMNEMRSRVSKTEFNKVSVQVELQADCYAGVWAHHANRTKPFLNRNDIDEAIKAASAVGDDTIQRSTQGSVVPDSFTHGTSAQRVRWFKTGFEQGTLQSCDTFKQPI